MTAMLAFVAGVPLAVALLIAVPATRARAVRLVPVAMLPALGVALISPNGTLELDWLLLGTKFGLDALGRLFLLFSAVAWTLAAFFARTWLAADACRTRFSGFFIAAAAGNLGVFVAQDIASFYCWYSLMTFSAYGLIVHHLTPAARRAGTVYLVLAVIGEAAVLVALLMIAATSGWSVQAAPAGVVASPWRDVIIVLLVIGFGVKIGVVGLHVALPITYGAAPAPGAAVLASGMIKAALFGWLRFLPLGYAVPEWSAVFVVLGLAAAFYGVVVGLMQHEPKVILAYSSMSQMGLITAGVGLGMASAAAGAPALAAVALYAAHHALVKGALFLGEAFNRTAEGKMRVWTRAGLVLLALMLAGAPFTSGALAKHGLKDLGGFSSWPQAFNSLLGLAAVGTTLLMAHFLRRVWHVAPAVPVRRLSGLALPSMAMVLTALLLIWLTAPMEGTSLPAADVFADAVWPILVGVFVAVLGARLAGPRRFTLPPGDVLAPIEIALRRVLQRMPGFPRPGIASTRPAHLLAGIAGYEKRLGSWRAAGTALLLLLMIFLALLVLA